MADEPHWNAGEHPLSAEEVASSVFPTAFRGFDPVEVRAFLARVADELRAAAEREAELRDALGAAASSDATSAAQLEVDAAREESARLAAELQQAEARLADREDRARLREADLAEQSSRALTAASEEAARLVATAKEEAARVVREAREEAGRLGAEADRVLAEAKEGAASAGIEQRRDAERDAAVIRVKAREEADAIIEASKERGREMVGEAQAARERMLKDLARRRRAAEAQLEHLKDARDRVMEHLRLARRSVDEITSRFEPVESGWVTTASGPPRPGLPARAQIESAPSEVDARGADPQPAAPEVDPTPPSNAPPAEPAAAEATDAVEATAPADRSDDVRPTTREERKSSALRILRRGRSHEEQAPAAHADEPVEGVRLIGPPPRLTPGDADFDEAAVPAELSEPSAETPEVAAEEREDEEEIGQAELGEVEAVEDVFEFAEASESDGDADVSEDDVEVDLVEREPIRPGETLDDLFARLRAGREASSAEPAEHASAGPAEAPVANDDELSLQRRDVAVEEAEGTMARRLKRAMQDEQNTVLDALRTLRGTATIEALLGPPDAQQQRFRRLAASILGGAAGAAAGAPTATVAVDDLVDAFATEVSGVTRDRLTRALAQAKEEDLEAPIVAERLNAVYRDFKGQRAERVGEHFVIAAHARGAFEAAPEGASLRWVVDDGGPCPDCDDNALAGPVPKGTEYPTGQLHPPAHIGCRCLLVPASTT